MAELRVSPGNLPYGASVSARWMYEFGTLTLFGVAGKGKREQIYPFSVWPAPRWGSSSTTSKTLMVRSEEHVARRLP
jgi:hypothetical protein